MTTVEVTPDELREAFERHGATVPSDATHPLWPEGSLASARVQQGLLRALSRALQELLETATDRIPHTCSRHSAALVERVRAGSSRHASAW